MISQSILLELAVGDTVQLYMYTSSGITDHKASRYTHLVGLLLRPSVDSLHDIVMRIGGVDLDEDVSVADNNDTNGTTAASPRLENRRAGFIPEMLHFGKISYFSRVSTVMITERSGARFNWILKTLLKSLLRFQQSY